MGAWIVAPQGLNVRTKVPDRAIKYDGRGELTYSKQDFMGVSGGNAGNILALEGASASNRQCFGNGVRVWLNV